MFRKGLLALAICLAATVSSANTAADENGGAYVSDLGFRGNTKVVGVYVLCSNVAPGDSYCTPFDLKSAVGINDTIVIVQMDDANGVVCTNGVCTREEDTDTCTVTPEFTYYTAPYKRSGSNQPPVSARAIGNKTTTDDTSAAERVISLNMADSPLDRYLFAEQTGDASNCTAIDVLLYIYARTPSQ